MDKQFDLVLMGHFARDRVLHDGIHIASDHPETIGGGVTFGGLAAKIYDKLADIAIVSKGGTDLSSGFLELVNSHQIDLSGVEIMGDKTTTYELNYMKHSRIIRLVQRAPDIDPYNFPELLYRTKTIHITPIAGEISLSVLSQLSEDENLLNCIFGLDLQGFVRSFDKEGYITPNDRAKLYHQLIPILKHFGPRMYLKASDEEIQYLTGLNDIVEATQKLGEAGINILTTMGARGLYFKMAQDDEIMFLPAFEPNHVLDETGAGDCFMAILLLELIRPNSIPTKLKGYIPPLNQAAAAASFLIEAPGPQGFQNRDHVLRRVAAQRRP